MKYSELFYNKQQFVEVAVREKIEKLKFLSPAPPRAV
jgi:hypothetical protein